MELGRGEPHFLLGSLRFSHRCRWQYGYWCKQNNWETGTRVPLIISAPWLPAMQLRLEGPDARSEERNELGRTRGAVAPG